MKMSEVKERKEMDPRFEWDLTPLYESDEAWEKDVASAEPLIAACTSWRGKLNTAAGVKGFLEARNELTLKMENLYEYASLRHTEDTRETQGQRMSDRIMGVYTRAMSAISFARPEFLSLEEDQIRGIISDPLLKDYVFLLEDLLRTKAHTLDEGREALLADLSEALSTPDRVSSALMNADMIYEPAEDSNGGKHDLTDSTFILLQTSRDRTLRRNAFTNYYRSYRQHNNTLAAAFAGNVRTACVEAAVRNYASSREASMSSDNIPVSVYDNLIETIHRHMDVMHRYAALRKKILKLDELHYYDLYTPLAEGIERRYSYEEAQELVLRAVAPLGENYGKIVRSAFADRWIDVYPNKGKSGGAFSAGTYTSYPYIMTNFTGTLDSVSTIAHEMGHSLHTWHTNHTQPVQYAGYSLFVAEVASTVNENLLIEQLLKDEKEPLARLALLNQYLEGFKGTVYRQTMFAEFEKEAHAIAERHEALDAETLNSLYERLVREYFGDVLVMDDEVKYEWSRIPHFYSPFYVYVYATGYSAAVALSQKILTGGEEAVKRYLEFLSMGSSRYPIDELKHAGVDLTTPEPIETALAKFAEVLAEAEAIADSIL